MADKFLYIIDLKNALTEKTSMDGGSQATKETKIKQKYYHDVQMMWDDHARQPHVYSTALAATLSAFHIPTTTSHILKNPNVDTPR